MVQHHSLADPHDLLFLDSRVLQGQGNAPRKKRDKKDRSSPEEKLKSCPEPQPVTPVSPPSLSSCGGQGNWLRSNDKKAEGGRPWKKWTKIKHVRKERPVYVCMYIYIYLYVHTDTPFVTFTSTSTSTFTYAPFVYPAKTLLHLLQGCSVSPGLLDLPASIWVYPGF